MSGNASPACYCSDPTAQPLVLSRDGWSNYRIVIAAAADGAVRAAADDLAWHLEQITGAVFPIVADTEPAQDEEICVGASARFSPELAEQVRRLPEEGYLIRTEGWRLVIAGGRCNGTLHGVYVFLEEHLGCRWYSSEFSVIPRQAVLALPPLDVEGAPCFEARMLIVQDDVSAKDPTWRARMRLNGFGPADDPRHADAIRAAGRWTHGLQTLLPATELFEAHPEYFSEIGGKRVGAPATQICTENAAAVELLISNARRLLRADPGARILSLTQNDDYNYCRCDQCRARHARYGVAGTWMRFVNEVARTLGPEFPHVLVQTYGYIWTNEPTDDFELEPNVVIQYAPIESCSYHAYEDPACVVNVEQGAAAKLAGWLERAERVWIWYYVLDGAPLHPYPAINCLEQNFRLFKRLGVQGIAPFCLRWGKQFSLLPLREWLGAKLVWDPEFIVQRGVEEFCRAYYGAAAETMLGYVHETQDEDSYQKHADGRRKSVPEDDIGLGIPERLDIAGTRFLYPPRANIATKPGFHVDFIGHPAPRAELLKKWLGEFERMERLVSDDPGALTRVRREFLTVLWCCLLYLPPEDPARLKAQVRFLPLAESEGNVWLSHPEKDAEKLWLDEAGVEHLKRAWPEFAPPG